MKKLFLLSFLGLVLILTSFLTFKTPGVNFPDKFESLRLVIEDLDKMNIQDFNKANYLDKVAALEESFDLEAFKELRKEIILQNPLLDKEIIFISRRQYKIDHHNTATLFQTGEINTNSFDPGGAIKAFHPKSNQVRTIIKTKDGLFRDPEVSFDGKKMLVSFRTDIESNYHIYELDPSDGQLNQLTGANDVTDVDPIYLPDGGIAFSSTREPKYCMCNRHIMANLYRMDDDGANINQIGKSTLFEGHSALLNDGRIIYDRWEYVDRNFGDAQGLWTTNPDGTNHAIYYGNNTNSPGGIIDPRAIPGSKLVLCIFSSCHDRPWGALTLIDREKGVDGKEAVVKIWPSNAYSLIGKGNWDKFMSLDVRYEDPYPLSEKYFLCSKSIWLEKNGDHPKTEKMGIFLVDIFGNELLLHEEESSCFDPMPLAPRYKPPHISERRNYEDSSGFFYVQNVYEGTHMQGVENGSIRYLRVVESPPKLTWTLNGWGGQGAQAPGMNWHSFENKRILGTVGVEEDGSAFFEVPSGKYVYFQLLDENKKMVHSMRSGTIAHPGETNGCIGCHENRLSVPVNSNKMPLALRSQADTMDGWMGHSRTFNYLRDVQPVFDKACLKCHDFNTEGGQKLILAGDKNPFFNASYIDLHLKKQIKSIGGGPAEIQQAYSWGSHASKLVSVIEAGHYGVSLSEEQKHRIYTWIDLNAVYYPEYESAFPDNPAGRSPLSFDQLTRLGELCGVDFTQLAAFQRNLGPQIAFERPELSPCLAGIAEDEVKYMEALNIIIEGKKSLESLARADMDGFEPCDTHQTMLKKYNVRADMETDIFSAIRKGEKIYDKNTR